MPISPDLIPIPLVALVSLLCSIPVYRLHFRRLKLIALPVAIMLTGQGLLYILFYLSGLGINERGFVIRSMFLFVSVIVAIISMLTLKYTKK